jgi:hypothetical protein
MDALAELEAMISGLDEQGRKDLDALIATELGQKWLPNPGPQAEAYYSDADLMLYGGAAGGGKTDLIVGLALAEHKRTVIFRRAYGELSDIAERFLDVLGARDGWNGQDMRYRKNDILVEFGALEKPGSEKAWRGRAHDLCCFDEGAELSQEKISFVMGWIRSTDPDQRCRAVIASNPPTGGDGDWMLEWFAPWLDPLYPEPARAGELRWCIRRDDETVWVDGPGKTQIGDETYTHESRTFVPALLDDNPYLKETGYRAKIQNLPEPLRSQLLKGDFLAGREDHAWQVIPTSWVVAANDRWNKASDRRRTMLALSADVAGEGADRTALASLHEDAWFAPLIYRKGSESKASADIPLDTANLILLTQRDGCDLSVDGTGGWGSGVRSHLKNDHDLECASIVFSGGSNRKTKDGKLGYKNLRSDMYWGFREALDPESGDEIKLPPDPRLMAELTAARYTLRGTDILIESKDDIKARIGGSPDGADAIVIAWHRRKAAIKPVSKEPIRLPKMTPAHGSSSWMQR